MNNTARRIAAALIIGLVILAGFMSLPQDRLSAAGTVPLSFFSMNNDARTGAGAYPTFPIGGVRIWDPLVTGWAGSQTGPSTYNFTQLNARLTDAPTNYDIMWTAGCSPNFIASSPGSTTPCQGNNAGSASLPSDVATTDATWKGFITALVNNSLAQSHHIKFYEMNNEADLAQYCYNGASLGNTDCTTNATNLVTMVKDAYTIIHALDPTALVVSPTGSTTCTNNCGVHLLPAFFAAGGAPYIDIVGMHSYLFNIPTPGAFSTVPEQITNVISQLRTLMTANGISGKPLWFTEGSYGGGTNNTNMTDDQKVGYLARDYLLMRIGGVARFYWYAYGNTGWGTLFNGTTLTKAGIAYSIVSGWMVGSTDLSNSNCVQDGSQTWQCSIIYNGNPAIIIWNPTNTPAVTLSSTYTSYLTLDNTVVNPIVSHSITAGLKPVMVTAGGVVLPSLTITNIQATAITSTSATITWTTSNPANSIVNYGLCGNLLPTATNNTLVTTHTVILAGLTPSSIYTFNVESFDGTTTLISTNSAFTTLASTGGNPTIPAPPIALAISTPLQTFQLQWSPSPSHGVTSYKVYRSATSGSGYVNKAQVTGTLWIDNAVTSGQKLFYVVTAVCPSCAPQESPFSNQIMAVIP